MMHTHKSVYCLLVIQCSWKILIDTLQYFDQFYWSVVWHALLWGITNSFIFALKPHGITSLSYVRNTLDLSINCRTPQIVDNNICSKSSLSLLPPPIDSKPKIIMTQSLDSERLQQGFDFNLSSNFILSWPPFPFINRQM